ncbi:leucyl/phenylalanyl-tRNA--protein transferase [Sediminibacterium ginsengisoli]|uniref:Leucyl/phenylalanyl-tRNA--protein transferase n=1 Tax=Sediminibacterium ginsengisoli TaxID=413434 RepID=A0A1T4P399_9BACT|nr:leucyl/phenylalanyl-tRNA--protein transferase [Sediminibacterium ginsengisoli]SJZ86090.1 leucyl/phenylalanyl-tRNA--protein transferase [Sediminibacterium ginsengisoli]
MPLYALDDQIWFPPVHEALEDGLLAMGGDLGLERLLLAYRCGIFPWFDGDIPLWWSPDPRFVLFPEELKESKSMKVLQRKNSFRFTTNTAFPDVIAACKTQNREGQDGTWITDELETSFNELHQLGYAHSAEAWQGDELVGGLYGIRMGRLFFGESMFSRKSNASKFAFIQYVKQLQQENVALIDCQVYTAHLESLGARMISRTEFINMLEKNL